MQIIKIIQNFVLFISLVILSFLPLMVAFGDNTFLSTNTWYTISSLAVFLVMLIRPLSDIFPEIKILRKLVILRKSFGVLSASIVVAFMLGKIISPNSHYLSSIFTVEYWSIKNYAIFAHLGDITGFILLITSNNLSITLLKRNWKRIQKLAYVYFYSGAIYKILISGSRTSLVAIIIITTVVIWAFILNRKKEVYQTLEIG